MVRKPHFFLILLTLLFGCAPKEKWHTATTGDYQRYFEIDNARYHHVFNPYAGSPAQNKQSVTVIGSKTSYCDALSTALFASPTPEKIIKKHAEYGAIIIDSRGKVFMVGKPYSFNPVRYIFIGIKT